AATLAAFQCTLNGFDDIVHMAGGKRIVSSINEYELPRVDCLWEPTAEWVAWPPKCRWAKCEGAETKLVGRQHDWLGACLACQGGGKGVRGRRCTLLCLYDRGTCIVHDDSRRADVDEGRCPGFLGRRQKLGSAFYISFEERFPGARESE